MKSTELRRLLGRHLLPVLPGYQLNRRLVYKQPVGDILYGFYFDSSAYRKSGFYLHAFVQPLFVRFDHLIFTYGDRIGSWWDVAQHSEQRVMGEVLDEIRRRGLPLHASIGAPRDLAQMALAARNPPNYYDLEVAGYCWAVEGEWVKAAQLLNEMLRAHERELEEDSESDWRKERIERAKVFLELIHADRETASAELRSTVDDMKRILAVG